jgi:hypothetical protein
MPHEAEATQNKSAHRLRPFRRSGAAKKMAPLGSNQTGPSLEIVIADAPRPTSIF